MFRGQEVERYLWCWVIVVILTYVSDMKKIFFSFFYWLTLWEECFGVYFHLGLHFNLFCLPYARAKSRSNSPIYVHFFYLSNFIVLVIYSGTFASRSLSRARSSMKIQLETLLFYIWTWTLNFWLWASYELLTYKEVAIWCMLLLKILVPCTNSFALML